MTSFVGCLVLTAVVLSAPLLLHSETFAESYVGGQLGINLPNSLSNVELIGGGFAPGTTVSDIDLNNSFMYGAKLGHYFEGTPWFKDTFKGKPWLGLETELFNSNPNIKEQVTTVTEPGVGASTVRSPGSSLRVLTWAFNLVARYPGERWQPYAGLGLGIFFAHLTDKSLGDSQSSTTPGLNAQVGLRYIINKQLSAFGEYKFNYTRMKLGESAILVTQHADYSAHLLAFGIAYHF